MQELIGKVLYDQLIEDMELLTEVMPELDREKVRARPQERLRLRACLAAAALHLFA